MPGNPITHYVILSVGRSGTTMLNALLDGHPRLTAAGELFSEPQNNQGRIPWPNSPIAKDPGMFDLWARDPMGLYDLLFDSKLPADCRVAGFRLMYEQAKLHPEILDRILRDKSFRIIHLKRHNLLRRHLSNSRAVETDVWRVGVNDDQSVEMPPQELDLFKCLNDFRWIETQRTLYDDMFKNHAILEVFYEDLAADPLAIGGRVAAFLGLEPDENMKIKTRKTGTDPLRDAISNYETLKANLTQWVAVGHNPGIDATKADLARWLSFFDE